MSKQNQIESELDSIDGSKFHSLCNSLLYREGHKQLNAIGKVIGKDKSRTGTPDTLITLPNGTYVFVEITTKTDDPGKKFLEDIEKCFDESKTGIPVTKISQIILCYNGELNTQEIEKLNDVCIQNGSKIERYEINRIALSLFHYPILAKDYLGVEIDTRQILDCEDFVRIYGENKLATSLDNLFVGREKEITQVLDALKSDDVVMLSGQSGSGKTRVAIEAVKKFLVAHPEYRFKCVLHHGENLHPDIHAYLAPSGNHIVLVDDANRVPEIENFISRIQDKRPDRIIKLIFTTRDYALQQVKRVVEKVSTSSPIEILPLTKVQMDEMLVSSFGIQNSNYQKRIYELSKGNPRLAVMCVTIAIDSDLSSLNNVSEVYSKYYQSIREDLTDLGDTELLKVAGIISFLRNIDFNSSQQIEKIESAFGISKDSLLAKITRLDQMEVVDMYDKEIVKVSDQVLSTYLLYLSVIEMKVLDFGTLVTHYFPQDQHLFLEMLFPIITCFDRNRTIRVLGNSLKEHWIKLSLKSENEQRVFLRIFYFTNVVNTLEILKSQIDALTNEDEQITVPYSIAQFQVANVTILDVIGVIPAEIDSFISLIKLTLLYSNKRPSEVQRTVKLFTERWGFRHTSYHQAYNMQDNIVKTLVSVSNNALEVETTRIFCEVAKNYLNTHFNITEGSRDGHSIENISFDLIPTQDLYNLRKQIWDFLIAIFEKNEWHNEVKNVFKSYCLNSYMGDQTELLAFDSAILLPFCVKHFDHNSYGDCELVHDLLTMYRRRGLIINSVIENNFNNESWIISRFLIERYYPSPGVVIDVDAYDLRQKLELENYCEKFGIEEYRSFFAQCKLLKLHYELTGKDWEVRQIHIKMDSHLTLLAGKKPDLFADIFVYAIDVILPIHSFHLISTWKKILGKKKTLEIFQSKSPDLAIMWTFAYYMSLTAKEITPEEWQGLSALYFETQPNLLPIQSDFLLNYLEVEPDAIFLVISFLLNKIKENEDYLKVLASFVRKYEKMQASIVSVLEKHIDLLQQALFAVCEKFDVWDYNGQFYNSLQGIDSDFTNKYLLSLREIYRSHRRSKIDFSVIWMRDDYELILDSAFDVIFESFGELRRVCVSDMLKIEGLVRIDKKVVLERQDAFIRRFIEQYANNSEKMRMLFSALSFQWNPDFIKYYLVFIERNPDLVLFKTMPLVPSFSSGNGSLVPAYQQIIDSLIGLRNELNPIDFSEHRLNIEKHIQFWRTRIEEEQKSKWMRD